MENRGRVNYGNNIDTQRKGGSSDRPGEELLSLFRLVHLFAISYIERPLGTLSGKWLMEACCREVDCGPHCKTMVHGGLLKGHGAWFTCI